MRQQTLIFLSTPNSRGIHKVGQNLATAIQNSSIYSPTFLPQIPFFILLSEFIVYPIVSILRQPKSIIFVNSRISPVFSFILRPRKLIYIHDLVNTNIPPFSLFNQYSSVFIFINTLLIKASLPLADIVLTNSKATANYLFDTFTTYKKPSFVCSPLPSFSESDLTQALRMQSDSSYPISKPRLLIVTGSSPNKGLSNYCSFLNILSNLITEDIAIDIVGLDPTSETARRISDSTSNTTNFHYHLSNTELCSLYLNTNLFVSLSLFEGFGIPFLDSKCFAIPSVLSDIDAFREQYDASSSEILFLPPQVNSTAITEYRTKIISFINSSLSQKTSPIARSKTYLYRLSHYTSQLQTQLEYAIQIR